MHELHALSRLALIRHRWELQMLLVTSGIGLAIAVLLSIAATDRADADMAIIALVFALLPAGLAGAILFDYAQGGDIVSPASGCSHWLLRMPIEAWKIAIVPVVLKTVWISALWLIFAMSVRSSIGVPVPLLTPCFYLSAAAIWLMVVAWLPLRSGWHRVMLLAVLFVTIYLMLWLVFGSLQLDDLRWRATLVTAGTALSLVMYLTAALAAIRVVGVARTAAAGIIPEYAGRPLALPSEQTDASVERVFASPLRALGWSEFKKTKHFVIRTVLIGAVPSILIGGLLLPFNPATFVIVLIVFSYLAGISICGHRESTAAAGSTLPVYLLTSPLTAAEIAWTRAAVWLGLATSVFSCVSFVFLLWALWPSNREAWLQWASEQAMSVGGGASPWVIGLRLSAAILLAAAIFLIGRIVAYWWIGMSGRNWFILLMTIVSATIVLLPFSLVLRWFMVQTQWSEVQAALHRLLTWTPQIVAGLLLLKTVATAVVAALSLQRRVVSLGTIGRVTTAWMMLVLLLGTVLAMLIPHPNVTLMICWGAVAVTIPLARVLVMPRMVAWNRYR